MEKIEYTSLTEKKLFNYFYNTHESILVCDNDIIKGAITLNSFINYDDLTKMIREVVIINNENEIEIGDLRRVYCICSEGNYIEITKKEDPRYAFTIERFIELYDNNDIIVNYIKSLKYNKIYLIGKNKNYIYNFINMYGLNISVILVENEDILNLFNADNDALIIDTGGFNIGLLKKINKIQKLRYEIFDLKELSKNAEIFNFCHYISNNDQLTSFIFRFPDINEFQYLTPEEKNRIDFDHYYKYYYEGYLKEGKYKELLHSVFNDLFSKEFIESRYTMPKVYSRGGVFYLEDSNNPYCQSFGGKRITTNQEKDYCANLNIFGACTVFGALTDDYNTFPSYMQRIINDDTFSYKVNNYGARAIDFSENLRTFRNIKIYKNDINVFLVSSNDASILSQMGFNEIKSITPVFNNLNLKNYFIDEPAHCNHEANKLVANYIYRVIRKELNAALTKDMCTLVSIPTKKCIFKDNKYLTEYLKKLECYRNYDGITGSIVMNCNPFTYGHYNLINYARKYVDRLMVFVVEEDKSYFSFSDRFKMVLDGCKDFDNVIVIPSGNLLASAMLFPEYFEKEDNLDITIDASKDIEVFCQHIAPYFGIKVRFVGEENFDKVTHAYNVSLKQTLPEYGIRIIEIPRYTDKNGVEISAKRVRKSYEEENWEELESQVPNSTIKTLRLIKDRSIMQC